MAVLEICHQVVMTPAIRREWNDHKSFFASNWLGTMKAKRKYHLLREIPEIPGLRDSINGAPWPDERKKKAWKDVHLVEAADATDKAVISCDDKARSNFQELAKRVQGLKEIVWVNPWNPREKCVPWLTDGAPSDPTRRLGFPHVCPPP